jgi:hypothetical protein
MARSILALPLFLCCARSAVADEGGLMVRFAEIEVDQSRVEEYLAILKEEARASVAGRNRR